MAGLVAGPPLRRETEVAVAAVQRGLGIAAAGVTAEDVTSKGVLDVVTTADVAVEDLIRSAIEEQLQMPVVGEERGGEAGTASAYWLVDPICGTRNFASGIPLYCVNVALVEDDRVTIGVAGDPSTGDVAIAERDAGAWALHAGSFRPLSVDDSTETVVVEPGRATPERRDRAAELVAAATRAGRWELRNLSTTLGLVYVAAGRVSAYVVFYGSAVHTAAGSLLAAEAGAIVSDVDGGEWTVRSDSIVAAATAELHAELLAL